MPRPRPDDWFPKGSPEYNKQQYDKRSSEHPDWKGHTKRLRLKTKYGISPEERDELLVEQNCRCAVCFTDTPGGRWNEWHVDHDHETNKIRGLLCTQCNTALGLLKDDVTVLKSAITYLEERK